MTTDWIPVVPAPQFPRVTDDEQQRVTTDGQVRIYNKDGTMWTVVGDEPDSDGDE